MVRELTAPLMLQVWPLLLLLRQHGSSSSNNTSNNTCCSNSSTSSRRCSTAVILWLLFHLMDTRAAVCPFPPQRPHPSHPAVASRLHICNLHQPLSIISNHNNLHHHQCHLLFLSRLLSTIHNNRLQASSNHPLPRCSNSIQCQQATLGCLAAIIPTVSIHPPRRPLTRTLPHYLDQHHKRLPVSQ